jgi:hypothetical protein
MRTLRDEVIDRLAEIKALEAEKRQVIEGGQYDEQKIRSINSRLLYVHEVNTVVLKVILGIKESEVQP